MWSGLLWTNGSVASDRTSIFNVLTFEYEYCFLDDHGGNIIRGSFLPDAVPTPAQLPCEGSQEWTGYRLYRDFFFQCREFSYKKYPVIIFAVFLAGVLRTGLKRRIVSSFKRTKCYTPPRIVPSGMLRRLKNDTISNVIRPHSFSLTHQPLQWSLR